jgi:manganese-transporting P-type ATPase
MITGDNPLTACHTAKELEIVRENPLILDGASEWTSVDEAVHFAFEEPLLRAHVRKKHHLCITGNGMRALIDAGLLDSHLQHIRVFARVSPDQKDWILSTLKRKGYMTLMCGDGTNDVGALKQAHIGKSLNV